MPTPEEIARIYQSPRAIEIEALKAYADCKQYEGRPDWFDNSSEAPLFERKPCINYAITKSAIGSHVGFVLGEGRWPTLTSATSEDDRALDEEWGLDPENSALLDRFINVVLTRYARLKETAREMLSDAMASKSVAVVASVRSGRLTVETVRASWCIPTLNDLGECLSLEVRYPFIETFYNDATHRWERRCMLYRRKIDGKTDAVYTPAVALESGNEPEWSIDKTRTKDHGLGFCPVIWYPFMQPCGTAADVDGVAIHAHQLGEIDCLNVSLSQKQRASTTAGDPQMVETGVSGDHDPAPTGRQSTGIHVDPNAMGPDGKPMGVFSSATTSGKGRRGSARKRGAGVIWRYPDKESKVAYLTLPPDALKSIDDHARDLRGKIAEALYAVFMDITELKTHATMSGKALSFLFQHQLGFDDQVRDDFGYKALIPLVSMLLRIVLVVGRKNPRALYVPGVAKILPVLEGFEREREADDASAADKTKADKVWMPPRLEPVWGPYFAPNEQDQLFVVQLVCQALQANAITREMAVEKLATSGVFEVGSAAEVVDAILADKMKEQQASDGALHQAISALGGAPQESDSGDHVNPADVATHGPANSASAQKQGATSPPAGALAPNKAQGSKVADAAASGSKAKVSAVKNGSRAAPAPVAQAQPIHEAGTSTAGVTQSVITQLSEDYPPDALGWVRAAQWDGPTLVPLDEIDYSGKSEWQASEASDAARVAQFVEKIQGGEYDKPIILVNEPNNEKLIIVDGHHRALAYQQLGQPANAYVATVTSVAGPWDSMHVSQRSQKSKRNDAPPKTKP